MLTLPFPYTLTISDARCSNKAHEKYGHCGNEKNRSRRVPESQTIRLSHLPAEFFPDGKVPPVEEFA